LFYNYTIVLQLLIFFLSTVIIIFRKDYIELYSVTVCGKNKNKEVVNTRRNILNQKLKGMMERLKAYGFVTEPTPEIYRKTKLFEKYYEEGERFSLDNDEDILKFITDNNELFLEVVGDEFFSKMKINNEMFKNYVINYIRKNNRINSCDLSDKAIIRFSKKSGLTEDELEELKTKPFFKDIFNIRISKILETLTEFGLIEKSN